MQDQCYKTPLTLFIRVVAFLVLSIPATGYTGNSIGSSSGYRGSQGLSSGYRGLDRSHGKHSTHRQDSRHNHSVAIKQKKPGGSPSKNRSSHGLSSGHLGLNKSHGKHLTHRQNSHYNYSVAIKQKKPGGSPSKNRSSHGLSSGHHDLNKSQGLQSSSRQKRNHRQRENLDRHKKSVYIRHDKRSGTVGQQIIDGRNKRFKTQKNPVTHKNQGLTTNFKSQVNHTQLAAIRPDKMKGEFVPTKPQRSFKHPIAIGQHRDNLGKKDTVSHTQHKQHISHARHNQHRHHGHRKHHGHSSPYVFFSYNSHYHAYSYYPYSYYPYSYYSGYYPHAYPVYRSYRYSSPAYSYKRPVYSTSKPYGIDSPGWTYLAQGNFQSAINTFAKDIQSFPDAGIPKIGFALASAAAGNLTEGVLVMREAFYVDPDSIHYLYFDNKMILIIDDLIEQYEYELQQSNKRPDEAFMVSALHYLKYNYGSAHEAINRAIIDGDKSSSLGKLHRLVDEQLSNEYAGEYN